MTKPYSVVLGMSTTVATPFITAGENPVLVKNIYIHNTSAGNATVHLSYRKNLNGITSTYDMYAETINAGNHVIVNNIICINPYDSLCWYDNSSTINIIAHCVGIS